MALEIDPKMANQLIGYLFQFDVGGKWHPAQISYEALQDYFGAGMTVPYPKAFEANAFVIRSKARDVFLSNQVRSPFLLTTDDFK